MRRRALHQHVHIIRRRGHLYYVVDEKKMEEALDHFVEDDTGKLYMLPFLQ
jgi:hypothetical protein